MRATCVCGILALAITLQAVAAPEPKPISHDDSALIAEKLLDRIDVDEGLEKLPLTAILEYMHKRSGLTFLLDTRALVAAASDGQTAAGLENTAITLPALKRVRVETVLRLITDRIDAEFYITPDHVQITTAAAKDLVTGQAKRLPELYPDTSDEAPEFERREIVRATPYLTISFREKPLADALKEIATRAGRSIVISEAADEKAKTPITARLANVAFQTAAATLAEAAGLRAFRHGNVVVIVTSERAKAVEEKSAKLVGYAGFGVPQTSNTSAIEAKMKELEEKIKALEKAKK